MRIPEKIELVSCTYTRNDYGVSEKVESVVPVYGYCDSVSASEFFEAGRNGLNPQFRIVMTELDYHGQAELIRNGERFAIYRTYRPNNGTVELYCERKGGTNGES